MQINGVTIATQAVGVAGSRVSFEFGRVLATGDTIRWIVQGSAIDFATNQSIMAIVMRIA